MKENKLQSVVIITGGDAPAFCSYDADGKIETMSADVFEKSIDFCRSNNLSATIVYSNRFMADHGHLTDHFPHVKIVSFDMMTRYDVSGESDFIVINDMDTFAAGCLDEKVKSNIILRINLAEAKHLPMIVYQYHKLFRRLNVIFKDIPQATEEGLNRFRINIQPLKDIMVELFMSGSLFEFNMVTDRLVLSGVNSCEAGITHITIAPDGHFYICPAFYYHNEGEAVGTLTTGTNIVNSQLLSFEYSPLCKICDCYQCKRCIYLNKQLTRELNTPSHQQCVLSHHERNLTGMILQKLQNKEMFTEIKEISPLFYLDPLEVYRDNTVR